MQAESIGIAAMLLGAGRKTKEDKIDFAAGITLTKKVGEIVNAGDTICILHTNLNDWSEAEKEVLNSYMISENKPEPIKYIYKVIQ
jgi:pyrimidine-nucleoside phosphorylase/thymidine phosphorylase